MTKAATEARLATHVPVAPMRERFLELQKREGLTAAALSERLGWKKGTRTLRVLGIALDHEVGTPLEDKTVTYENAVKLCRALDMDPVDANV